MHGEQTAIGQLCTHLP